MSGVDFGVCVLLAATAIGLAISSDRERFKRDVVEPVGRIMSWPLNRMRAWATRRRMRIRVFESPWPQLRRDVDHRGFELRGRS